MDFSLPHFFVTQKLIAPDGKTGLAFIRTVLYYLTVATEKVSHEALKDSIRQHSEQGEQIMSTIAQELIEQGVEQGIEQSIVMIVNQRFGSAPSPVKTYLTNLSGDKLENVLKEALISHDLDAFMTYLKKIAS